MTSSMQLLLYTASHIIIVSLGGVSLTADTVARQRKAVSMREHLGDTC